MTRYFDDLETRSAEERAADIARALPEQIARAKALPGYGDALGPVDAGAITSVEALSVLPVLRKSDLTSTTNQSRNARPWCESIASVHLSVKMGREPCSAAYRRPYFASHFPVASSTARRLRCSVSAMASSSCR